MKKSIFFILLFSCSSLMLNAQIKLGLRVGVNTSSLSQENLDILDNSGFNQLKVALEEAKYGLHGGLVIQIGMGNFMIQPEVLFNSNEIDYKVSDVQTGFADKILKEKYQYLDIPLLLGYKLGGFLRLHAGPVGHVYLSNTSELTDISGYAQKFKEFTWGWQGGFGLDIGKLMIDLRYEGDFSKYGDHFEFFGDKYAFDQSPARFLISLGYLF